MKKVAWTIMMTMASAAGAALASRGASLLWSKLVHEPPPPTPWWARWLVGKPVQLGVSGALDGQR